MPEQQSPCYEDLFYQSEDGLTLYARDYPAPSPDSQCVLLMHGLSRNSRDFEVLANRLSTRYRVLVAEQRGRVSRNGIPIPHATRFRIMFEICSRFCRRQMFPVSPR